MKYEHDFQNWRGWAKRFLSNMWVLNNHSSQGKAGFTSPHRFVEEIRGLPPSATAIAASTAALWVTNVPE